LQDFLLSNLNFRWNKSARPCPSVIATLFLSLRASRREAWQSRKAFITIHYKSEESFQTKTKISLDYFFPPSLKFKKLIRRK
jgi:hypothetical protein